LLERGRGLSSLAPPQIVCCLVSGSTFGRGQRGGRSNGVLFLGVGRVRRTLFCRSRYGLAGRRRIVHSSWARPQQESLRPEEDRTAPSESRFPRERPGRRR